MLRLFVCYLLLLNGLMTSGKTYATNMLFHGTLIKPSPCVIDGTKPINVDFGDSVVTTKVDGINYKRPVDYTMTCNEGTIAVLRMQVKGSSSGFDTALLLTSVSDLGIQIIKDGEKIGVNEWFYFFNETQPQLEAVPVKNKDATLTGGKFESTATLLNEVI
ncbi:fimbrial protein [Yersinia mollaretii]|uniref:fimbrial protein n=1 Tax=Yersinia mollaretii TaxID=33060 RepID=UPI0011A141B6|nr:fimbrial protein [Yersinia mollaretii]